MVVTPTVCLLPDGRNGQGTSATQWQEFRGYPPPHTTQKPDASGDVKSPIIMNRRKTNPHFLWSTVSTPFEQHTKQLSVQASFLYAAIGAFLMSHPLSHNCNLFWGYHGSLSLRIQLRLVTHWCSHVVTNHRNSFHMNTILLNIIVSTRNSPLTLLHSIDHR